MKRILGVIVALLVGFILWRLLEPKPYFTAKKEIERAEEVDVPSPEPQPRNPKEREICRAAFETMGLKGRVFARDLYSGERQRLVSVFESVDSSPDYCYVEGNLIHWRPETAMGQVGRWRDLAADGQLSFRIQGSLLSLRWAFVDNSAVEESFTLERSPEEVARQKREQEQAKKSELARTRAQVMPWYRRFYPQLSRTHAELKRIALAVQRGSATPDDCLRLRSLVGALGARGIFESGDSSLDRAVVNYIEFAYSMNGNCPTGKKLIVLTQPTFLDNGWASVRVELTEMDL